jgi:glycosyltransferase involved in cell wall biosynthesis
VDTQALAEPRPPEEPGAIVFTGSYSYWPNEDAALRLIEMAPRLRRRGTLRKLSLVGIDPTQRMYAAAAGVEGVVITGRVPEVAPFLDRAALVVAPLAAGSGMKVKLLEAMARARPVLTTPVGAEGLAMRPGVHAEIVPIGQFEEKLAELMADPRRRAALASEGRRLVEALYSPAAVENQVRSLLDLALKPRGRSWNRARP